ncbi:DUF1616 domain-containing protein [Mycobacterium sp. E796]|uniref:DUF1616 domain-containing protein n=1 Tax=Mycobacterium sp. E796 TaxID=1834151 RepID=UPI0009EE8074|nr:DUF1616 domain-containing protein [Mycobacterium sp. E796]
MSLASPQASQAGMTTRARRLWFYTSFAAGCAGMNAATGYAGPIRVPQVIQLVLGLLMVFVVPGLSFVCAALPDWQSWVERLLASLGISIAVATCAVVLLAAMPMGFSRQPFGQLLGGITVVLSLGGLYRLKAGAVVWEPRAWVKKALSLVEERVAAGQRDALRLNNRTTTPKPQPPVETDARRSVMVLNFSFDGKRAGPRA